MTANLERCSKQVLGQGQWPKWYRCSRKATISVNEGKFCTQHSPDKVAERETKSRRQYDAESEKRRYVWAATAWCRAKGMTLEDLQSTS